jgi:hypothetical protein
MSVRESAAGQSEANQYIPFSLDEVSRPFNSETPRRIQ